MKSVKEKVLIWRKESRYCKSGSWCIPGIPKGLYFIETSIRKDALALIKLFQNNNISPDRYYFERTKNGVYPYAVWWKL
jgi:hypothetical protein